MGVKSINEEQSITTNGTNNKKQKNKNKKIKKKPSFSSITESSDSDSSTQRKKSSNKITNQKKVEKEEKEKNENISNDNKEKDIEKIKTLFEWDEGGDLVYLTGSFCEWKKFIQMNKNDKGVFSLTLSLPRGFYQYKFIVDKNWEYSKKQPKFEEDGNINNFIDTTDYEIENQNEVNKDDNNKEEKPLEKEDENEKQKKNEEKSEEKNEEKNEKKDEKKDEKNKEKNEEKKSEKKEKNKNGGKKKKKIKKRFSSTHSVNFLNSQNNYTIYYPLKSELNIKPSTLPCLYKAHFILNEDFKPKKERKFTKVAYVNDSRSESSESSSSSSSSSSSFSSSSEPSSKVTVFGEIIPYVKFQNLYHIHSNHLHSKMKPYKFSTVGSMTLRYRIKFATFIYYKPIKPKKQKEVKGRIKHSKTVKIKNKKK